MKFAVNNLILYFLFMVCFEGIGEGYAGNLLKFQPLEIEMAPGEVRRVKLKLNSEFQKSELFCEKQKIRFSIFNRELSAFIAIPYNYKNKKFQCKLKNELEETKLILNALVKKIKYKTSYISVPKRKVDLKDSDIKWWLQDKKELKKVYDNISNTSFVKDPFSIPLNSKVTSSYGSKRIFNNKKTSWHNGIDFRAKIGTPIPSSNRGKVVLVRHLFFNGKTVIVDHGSGILSLYCHLSSYKVKVGDIVKKEQILGAGGNTGRSSGPHLHWGVRVHGHWVNGFSLVDQSKLN